jgi:hypothetical protein
LSKARTDRIKQYFGMHYTGAIFDINNIEKRLREAQIEYQNLKAKEGTEK